MLALKGLFCMTVGVVGGLQWVGRVLKELINRDVSNMSGKDLNVRSGTLNYCTASCWTRTAGSGDVWIIWSTTTYHMNAGRCQVRVWMRASIR